mmetsp:Transcript_22437/g.48739  ORF Transcript_22437/g.48739 Transcript_22437/m.48739 type:complete len:209 (+) Transcript_22437:121-747(+)
MPRRPLSSLSVAAALFCGAEAAFVSSSGSVGISSPLQNSATVTNPSFVTNAPRGCDTPSSRQTSATATNAFLPFLMRDAGPEPSGSGRTQSQSQKKQYCAADLDRLREAAKNPDTFEQVVLSMKLGNGTDDSPYSNGNDSHMSEDAPETAAKKGKKGGYRRIEEWEEDLKNNKDGSGMTWEEKVMFDGQRHGNQVRQNDILIRNLHTW